MSAKAASKSTKATSSEDVEGAQVLPLPAALWAHHYETLRPWLKSWFEKKQVHPTLLITGPRGIGKRAVVHHLAQWLNCEKIAFKNVEPEDTGMMGLFGEAEPATATQPPEFVDLAAHVAGCGECGPCKLALKNQWVDFDEFRIDAAEGGTTLKIDQFRGLKSKQGFGAYQGAFHLILIDEAERLTPQAANSLLKLLEEPPPGWIFIMTSQDPTLILPTLLSRSSHIRLKPLTDDTLRAVLREKEAPAERIELGVRLSQGSYRVALEWLEPNAIEWRTRIVRFLQSPQAEFQGMLEWASEENEHYDFLLRMLETISLDVTKLGAVKTATPIHQDLISLLQQLTRKHPPRFWQDYLTELFEARAKLHLPLNRKLALQNLLLPLCLS